jgi:glycosyltransferase involved in cell wall biosynthesis
MMSAQGGISVVIPVYNEEETLLATLSEIKKYLPKAGYPFEIIVVNDGSQDRTSELLQEEKDVEVITHPRKRGYGRSLKSGILKAKFNKILIIDGDNTYPADALPLLIKEAQNYPHVVGARIGQKVVSPLLPRFPKWLLRKLASFLTGEVIPDLNSGLRIFSREEALSVFPLLPEGFSFTATLTLAHLCKNLPVKYLPINYYPRRGRSKIKPFQDTLNFFLLILKTLICFRPLKFFLPIGSVFFILGGIKLYDDIFRYHNVEEASLFCLFAAFHFFFFGILFDFLSKLLLFGKTRLKD